MDFAERRLIVDEFADRRYDRPINGVCGYDDSETDTEVLAAFLLRRFRGVIIRRDCSAMIVRAHLNAVTVLHYRRHFHRDTRGRRVMHRCICRRQRITGKRQNDRQSNRNQQFPEYNPIHRAHTSLAACGSLIPVGTNPSENLSRRGDNKSSPIRVIRKGYNTGKVKSYRGGLIAKAAMGLQSQQHGHPCTWVPTAPERRHEANAITGRISLLS